MSDATAQRLSPVPFRVSAPGRIELIGNHLDYNGGPVLAAAIDRRLDVLVQGGIDDHVRARFPDIESGSEHDLDPLSLRDWSREDGASTPADYLRGAIAALIAKGLPIRTGVTLTVQGNLPHGVGISSSAALCVGLVMALSLEPLERSEVVLLAQEAENRTGSPCGTMDQSASVYGDVIRYDGATNNVEPLRSNLGDKTFVVINSGVVRSLATSSYPQRVREAATAQEILRLHGFPDLGPLASLEPLELDRAEDVLREHGSEALVSRLHHIVRETGRVANAHRALLAGDWASFGALMTASGRSSAVDYEISHTDVERLVELCLTSPGVLGARMMGGGEGGAVLVLADATQLGELAETTKHYFRAAGVESPETMLIPARFDRGAFVAALSAGI